MHHLSAEELTPFYDPKESFALENENATVTEAPPMQPATRAYVKAFYQPNNEALIQIFGRSLECGS
jgi:hypothetical protein